jgi:hypothetical protein
VGFQIVMPLFRDVASFVILRERVREVLCREGTHSAVRFFVVDDSGGQDPEIEKIVGLPDVSVVRPPFNLGHQRAIVLGLRAASEQMAETDVVITMDSDGEDQPEDLPRLIQPVLDSDDPWTVAIARRTSRKENVTFRLLYMGFRALFRVLTGREVRSGNYAVYRGAYVHRMLFHPSFDLCYSSSLITLNPNPVFVPCARGERYAGQSHMNLERLLMHGVRMLMPFADRIAIRSLALCAATAAVTIVMLTTLLIGRLTGAVELSAGWSWVLLGGVVASGLGLVNFLVLFSGFVQTSALSLVRIDQKVTIDDGSA